MKRIGLISDTHSFFDERLLKLFADCDEVWHAGDVGDIRLLNRLKEWKPLRAVFGNIDDRLIRAELPEMTRFALEGFDVLMTHIGGYPGKYAPNIAKIMREEPPTIFVAGHSHILKVIYDNKYQCLHLNPGACGTMGIHTMRTALRFTLDSGKVENMEVIELGPRGKEKTEK